MFYVAAHPDDNWQVVEGLQRLGTLRSLIIYKRLRLCGLEYLSQLEGPRLRAAAASRAAPDHRDPADMPRH